MFAICACCSSVARADAATTAPIFTTPTGGGVAQYDPVTGKKTGFLPQGSSNGVAVDGSGDVFVGVTNPNPMSFIVEEFAPGAIRPTRVIYTQQQFACIAVDPGTGELAVAGSEAGSCCFNQLRFYEPGATQPSREITQYTDYGPVTYDGSGNCWVSAGKSGGGSVYGYVSRGGMRIVSVPVQHPPSGDPPIGIDGSGHLVIFHPGGFLVYARTGELLRTVRLQARPTSASGFVFSPDGSLVYVSSGVLAITVYRYPTGGAPVFFFGDYATGIARVVGS